LLYTRAPPLNFLEACLEFFQVIDGDRFDCGFNSSIAVSQLTDIHDDIVSNIWSGNLF
jgi:hypothetical protein